jgi:hypothetical protein
MAEPLILLPIEEQAIRGGYRQYFICKRTNYFASIQAFPELWDCFLRLDEIWLREFSDLERIRQRGQILPLHLFMNSHAQSRVGFELAFSSCLGEAWNIIRSSIESAVQAHKIGREPNLALVWMRKDNSPADKKAYKKAFEEHKRESLFPAQHGLDALYSYYCSYSEWGTHPTLAAVALRHKIEKTSADVNIRHEYLEGNPERPASSLFIMLEACGLIEGACFDCFKARLDLDAQLVRMRHEFDRCKAAAASAISRRLRKDNALNASS